MGVITWTATRPPPGCYERAFEDSKGPDTNRATSGSLRVCVLGWGGVLGSGGLCSEADVPLSGVPDRPRGEGKPRVPHTLPHALSCISGTSGTLWGNSQVNA